MRRILLALLAAAAITAGAVVHHDTQPRETTSVAVKKDTIVHKGRNWS